MDWYLLGSAVVVFLVLILISIYILAMFIHPDDVGFGSSAFPKAMVVLGLTLSMCQVLMVPLDISNSRGLGGGLPMNLFWQLFVITDFFFIAVLIPLGMFYYRSDENKSQRQRLVSSLIKTGISFIVFALFFFLSYIYFKEIQIPFELKTLEDSDLKNGDTLIKFSEIKSQTFGTSSKHIAFNSDFPDYIVAFFSFVGWWFFIFFAGIGLFAIPLDYIHKYRNRPQKLNPAKIQENKKELKQKVSELIDMGLQLENVESESREARGFINQQKLQAKVNKHSNKFKAAVLSVEEEFEKFSMESNYDLVNPLNFKLDLLIGIILLLISFVVWAHLLLNSVLKQDNGFPKNTFLNQVLLWLEDTLGLPFLAATVMACITLYLLLAVVKGNVKFGQSFSGFFTIHPMKRNETLMNSFLFNVSLAMISTLAIIQFITEEFSQYARLTTVQLLFGTKQKHMSFFKILYEDQIFELLFLCFSALFMFCNCAFGKQRPFKLNSIQKLKGVANTVSFGLVPE